VVSQILFGVLLVTFLSASGAFILFLNQALYESISDYLISLAAGTMIGGVFIHLVFRLANQTGYTRLTGVYIIAGLLISFILERLVHWHCHHSEAHHEPLPYVLAVGDVFHNAIDGVLIATSFLASTTAGLGSLVAVGLHKLPKEVSDYGVMVEHGFSKLTGLLVNIATSAFMFLGAGLVLLSSMYSQSTIPILLPIVIGNFLYISGSDLIPAFKHDDMWIKHLIVFTLGASIMYAIPYVKALIV
jgi:zinc transporter ZupT